MNKSTVAIIRCPDYDEARVLSAVKKGIDLLGGVSNFIKPDEKIVLKPNILWGSDPQKCVTTHPAVFKAVGKLLLEAGARVSYGDSPAFGNTAFHAKRADLKLAADELGIIQADFDEGETVTHKTSILNKKFTIANGILEADGVISLPKLKTHGLTRFTGAVKNQFGCIPGTLKGQFHLKMPDPYDFAAMLVDLNTLIKPRLYIMDGIMAMEGNGPRNGKPRKLNVLLFSRDPIALDSIACQIIGLDPEFVPTANAGEKAGLGTYHLENIELTGDEMDSFITRDFEVVRRPPAKASRKKMLTFVKNLVTPRPVINRYRCSGCGTCIKACPVGPEALNWMAGTSSKVPEHNYNRCIRCYCCQELCPEGAITIQSPLLGRVLRRI